VDAPANKPRRRVRAPKITATTAVVLAALGVGVGGLIASSSSGVTRARLERNLPQSFANEYVQQAKILGHQGITVQSLHARAQCDKGGPNAPDRGPGSDWICLMSWRDPYLDPTLTMPAKFELNVHSNDCYTAGGPSKFVGQLTITDKHGNDVPNPVFEWDACFNPNGVNRPTGVTLDTSTATTPATLPAEVSLVAGREQPDRHGRIKILLVCSSGDGGCAGTVTARLGNRSLGSATYAIPPASDGAASFVLTERERRSGGTLHLTAKPVIGGAKTGTIVARVLPT
jgi:hypothetical protein